MSISVGISGTGFIGRGLARHLDVAGSFRVGSVLTRRVPEEVADHPTPRRLTRSLSSFLAASDIVVECSGGVAHGTEVVDAAISSGLPVVTMNAEMQVTTGSWFVGRGLITEAEGDQPGSLAALAEEARLMGFEPVLYGNRKGYLELNPSPASMREWGRRQGISLEQVTAATDGTKVQIEQALVANGLGADIACRGLLGPKSDHLEDAARSLSQAAERSGRPLADYVLCPDSSVAVFIVARHRDAEQAALEYFRMGPGPFYVLSRGYHLCHLEVSKTLERVVSGRGPLLHNGWCPTVGVAAIAKRALDEGSRIARGIGGFDVRGEAVRTDDAPDHLPIGLMDGAQLTRRVEAGELLRDADVELVDTTAACAWREVARRTNRQDSLAGAEDVAELAGGRPDAAAPRRDGSAVSLGARVS